MSGVRYRRAPTLHCYWDEDRFIIHNYASGIRVLADAAIVALLQAAVDWVSARTLAVSAPGLEPATTQRALDLLERLTLVDSTRSTNRRRDAAFRQWNSWMPEAAAFHFGVRNVRYAARATTARMLARKAATNPPPAPLKRYPRAAAHRLPPPAQQGDLSGQLLDRRTWRRFGSGSVTREQLATLLGLTWGVQGWIGSKANHTLAALKTAPSGGARHSIEAYVLARRVDGLPPGLYHYEPDRHQLEAIGVGPKRIASYIPGQQAYARAAVLVMMTSIFARSRWRYGYPRAYRSIMFEAGHHCQTFLLLATSLGLAPFCTGALADSAIERDLGIDGITESVIYACGVGIRPAGLAWAPSPHGVAVPVRRPPAWARRLRQR